MENFKFLLDEPHAFHTFPLRKESELYLRYLGYDNFHYFKGLKTYRTQPFYTLHFIISGKGFLKFNGKKYSLQAGDAFVLPLAPEFCYYPDKKEPWEYVYFCFNGTLINEYLQNAGFSNQTPIRTCHCKEKIVSLFLDIFNKIQKATAPTYYEGLSLFLNILDSVTDSHSSVLQNNPNDIVEQAKQQIEDYFFDPEFTIERISKSLYISHARLSRLFKAQTGRTMVSYLNERRMTMAEDLLRTSSLSVSDIVYISGFRDYTHFLAQFKRLHGMTTKEYRILHKK